MNKGKKLSKNTEITVTQLNNEDYISLTDMLKAKDLLNLIKLLLLK